MKRSPKTKSSIFLRACAGEIINPPPVWIMRQAGRILKPYHDLKNRVGSIETLFNTPELAAEVTIMPVHMLGVDAAILFADIFTPIAPMGCEFRFQPGPVLSCPIRSRSAVNTLRTINAEEDLPHVDETIRLVRSELPAEIPLIGFAGAPITLATYLTEGSGKRDFTQFLRLLNSEPETTKLLLDKLTEVAISYLKMQIAAGAEAIQLFDTWIGQLSYKQFEDVALPYLQRIFSELTEMQVPTIYYTNNSAHLLPLLPKTGAKVFSLDWRVSMTHARKLLGPTCPIQGNLDPYTLFATHDTINQATAELLNETRGTPHIVNLGHGVHPETPIDSVRTMIAAVRGLQKQI